MHAVDSIAHMRPVFRFGFTVGHGEVRPVENEILMFRFNDCTEVSFSLTWRMNAPLNLFRFKSLNMA